MTPAKLFAVAAIGLSATACSYNSTTQATAPGSTGVVVAGSSQQACVDYGFSPGTASYDRCVRRDTEARARGRAPAYYTQANLSSDAQVACSSYGLSAGTMSYDRCVSREIGARRYTDQAAVTTTTTYRTPEYITPAPVPGATITSPTPAMTVYSTTTQVPAASYAPPATTPPAGAQAFRDEFGFRYDGQGNRIDARGNIISPQSTQP
jgi:hypothetical protein